MYTYLAGVWLSLSRKSVVTPAEPPRVPSRAIRQACIHTSAVARKHARPASSAARKEPHPLRRSVERHPNSAYFWDDRRCKRPLTLLGQILATRSLDRSAHETTDRTAEIAPGNAGEARPRGHRTLKRSSDGLAVPRRGLRSGRTLSGRHAAIADRDLSWPISDAVMLTLEIGR